MIVILEIGGGLVYTTICLILETEGEMSVLVSLE